MNVTQTVVIVAGIGGLPSNALTLAGVPLTFDSEILTFGEIVI